MTNSKQSLVGAAEAANQGRGSEVMVFSNPQFGSIRTITGENGEPLFCGKDVCEVLGYKKADVAIRQHVDKVDVTKRYIYLQRKLKDGTLGEARCYQTLFVNECGFYSLVFGSKLPIAALFKRWVASEVLPQIRKTGGYIPLREGDTQEDISRRSQQILRKTIEQQRGLLAKKDLILAQQNKRIAQQGIELEQSGLVIASQEQEIDRLLPKALYTDAVLDSVSCYTTTQVAKELGLTTQELNRLLCAKHIQYYQSGQYMLYADYAHMGLAKSRTHYDLFIGRDTIRTRMYLVWTEKGRKFIHENMEIWKY